MTELSLFAPIASTLKLKPQARVILRHLEGGKSITPMEALVVYSNARLAASVHEINKHFERTNTKLRVQKEMKKDERGHKYARYTLVKLNEG